MKKQSNFPTSLLWGLAGIIASTILYTLFIVCDDITLYIYASSHYGALLALFVEIIGFPFVSFMMYRLSIKYIPPNQDEKIFSVNTQRIIAFLSFLIMLIGFFIISNAYTQLLGEPSISSYIAYAFGKTVFFTSIIFIFSGTGMTFIMKGGKCISLICIPILAFISCQKVLFSAIALTNDGAGNEAYGLFLFCFHNILVVICTCLPRIFNISLKVIISLLVIALTSAMALLSCFI